VSWTGFCDAGVYLQSLLPHMLSLGVLVLEGAGQIPLCHGIHCLLQ
jgi:hypothetical protein